jgi:hypothetical protein
MFVPATKLACVATPLIGTLLVAMLSKPLVEVFMLVPPPEASGGVMPVAAWTVSE